MKRIKYILCALFIIILSLSIEVPVKAESNDENETDIIEINNVNDLLSISDNPSGSYILMRDIDMEGVSYFPIDFSGEFNGNGHAILNVTINNVGTGRATTYDGNMKTYDTLFAGFFGKLENARIYNLELVNIKAEIESAEPCFLGGFAGFMENSLIENCTLSGRLMLDVDAPMAGIGGMVGFGNGDIKNVVSDMTLIFIDRNVTQKDEQFMGGAYGAGYIGIDHCDISIDGYVSDHGYVHNGGMVGMFAVYPAGNSYKSYITYNHVEGQITFFEDNLDRRAYCKAYVGEVLHWTYEWAGCSESFKSNEIFEYGKNLYPDDCNKGYSERLVESTETDWGYTLYECEECGYSYRDKYVLKTPELERLRLEEEERIALEKEREEEASRLAAESTSQSAVATEDKKTTVDNKKTEAIIFGVTMCALLIILIGAVVFMSKKK